MKKFRVHGTVLVSVSTVVEAETPDEAIEKAGETWSGLSGYVGNGGMGNKLVGPADHGGDTIEETGDQATFESAEEVGDEDDE